VTQYLTLCYRELKEEHYEYCPLDARGRASG
jgi:hypothetical protein